MANSIVITAYNKAKYMETFLSVTRHMAPDAELVLVDDGSTDGTGEIMQKYADVFLHTPDVWETKANNVGLKAATGDYVAIVQDDDLVVSPGWLDTCTAFMRQNEKIGILSGRGTGCFYRKGAPGPQEARDWMADNQGETLQVSRGTDFPSVSPEWGCIRYDLFKRPAVVDGCMMPLVTACDITIRSPFIISRSLIDAIGYLDEIYSPLSVDDQDYCIRAGRAGFTVAFTLIPAQTRFEGGSTELVNNPVKHKLLHDAFKRNYTTLMERYLTTFPQEEANVIVQNFGQLRFPVP